ncbi:ribonuclease H-like domain-containing protein [Syncephalis fuscata]|nr:ribonuclease H-like domain-containing protein [Syncephalis fuscata]
MPKHSKEKAGKYYAVRVGRQQGIFKTWEECKANVEGYPRAAFKRFNSLQEAQKFIGKTVNSVANITASSVATVTEKKPISDVKATKKKRLAPYQRLIQQRAATSLSHSTPSLVESIKDMVLPNTSDSSQDYLVVYTDGSGLSNGQKNAVAGVGVYFGPGDARNISEPLPGSLQTNQRAEITAVIRALETVDSHQPIEIRTDSAYVVNATRSWINNWKKRNWHKSDGKAVLNSDLFRRLDELLVAHTSPVKFTHVRAHIGIPGNEAADRLAVNGARQAQMAGQDKARDKLARG